MAGVGVVAAVGVAPEVGAGVGGWVVAAPAKVPGSGPGSESSPPAKGLWPKERKVCVSSEVDIIRFVKILNFFREIFCRFQNYIYICNPIRERRGGRVVDYGSLENC